jgi:hypothetical protein
MLNLSRLNKCAAALALAIVPLLSLNEIGNATSGFKIIGLTTDNTLVTFGSSKSVRVTGVDGNLECIDVRPRDGLLYGLTDTDKVYTINPSSGAAKLKSTLSVSFNGGFQSGCDFNPVLDKLRLVGSNDQNFSVDVDLGTATPQTTITYGAGDANAGVDPNLTAAAYTNSVAGATSTLLYDLDYDLDVLAVQNPPPNGVLQTIGKLGINLAPIAGFDIFTDASGGNSAIAASGSTVYTINLSTGAAVKMGNFSRGGIIGLALIVADQDG